MRTLRWMHVGMKMATEYAIGAVLVLAHLSLSGRLSRRLAEENDVEPAPPRRERRAMG